jgi:hypothetical protein
MDDPHAKLAALLARSSALDTTIDALERERADIERQAMHMRQHLNKMDVICWRCTRPEADDVRHWLRNCSGDYAAQRDVSPSGLPLGCCRLRVGATLEHGAHMNGPAYRQIGN